MPKDNLILNITAADLNLNTTPFLNPDLPCQATMAEALQYIASPRVSAFHNYKFRNIVKADGFSQLTDREQRQKAKQEWYNFLQDQQDIAAKDMLRLWQPFGLTISQETYEQGKQWEVYDKRMAELGLNSSSLKEFAKTFTAQNSASAETGPQILNSFFLKELELFSSVTMRTDYIKVDKKNDQQLSCSVKITIADVADPQTPIGYIITSFDIEETESLDFFREMSEGRNPFSNVKTTLANVQLVIEDEKLCEEVTKRYSQVLVNHIVDNKQIYAYEQTILQRIIAEPRQYFQTDSINQKAYYLDVNTLFLIAWNDPFAAQKILLDEKLQKKLFNTFPNLKKYGDCLRLRHARHEFFGKSYAAIYQQNIPKLPKQENINDTSLAVRDLTNANKQQKALNFLLDRLQPESPVITKMLHALSQLGPEISKALNYQRGWFIFKTKPLLNAILKLNAAQQLTVAQIDISAASALLDSAKAKFTSADYAQLLIQYPSLWTSHFKRSRFDGFWKFVGLPVLRDQLTSSDLSTILQAAQGEALTVAQTQIKSDTTLAVQVSAAELESSGQSPTAPKINDETPVATVQADQLITAISAAGEGGSAAMLMGHDLAALIANASADKLADLYDVSRKTRDFLRDNPQHCDRMLANCSAENLVKFYIYYSVLKVRIIDNTNVFYQLPPAGVAAILEAGTVAQNNQLLPPLIAYIQQNPQHSQALLANNVVALEVLAFSREHKLQDMFKQAVFANAVIKLAASGQSEAIELLRIADDQALLVVDAATPDILLKFLQSTIGKQLTNQVIYHGDNLIRILNFVDPASQKDKFNFIQRMLTTDQKFAQTLFTFFDQGSVKQPRFVEQWLQKFAADDRRRLVNLLITKLPLWMSLPIGKTGLGAIIEDNFTSGNPYYSDNLDLLSRLVVAARPSTLINFFIRDFRQPTEQAKQNAYMAALLNIQGSEQIIINLFRVCINEMPFSTLATICVKYPAFAAHVFADDKKIFMKYIHEISHQQFLQDYLAAYATNPAPDAASMIVTALKASIITAPSELLVNYAKIIPDQIRVLLQDEDNKLLKDFCKRATGDEIAQLIISLPNLNQNASATVVSQATDKILQSASIENLQQLHAQGFFNDDLHERLTTILYSYSTKQLRELTGKQLSSILKYNNYGIFQYDGYASLKNKMRETLSTAQIYALLITAPAQYANFKNFFPQLTAKLSENLSCMELLELARISQAFRNELLTVPHFTNFIKKAQALEVWQLISSAPETAIELITQQFVSEANLRARWLTAGKDLDYRAKGFSDEQASNISRLLLLILNKLTLAEMQGLTAALAPSLPYIIAKLPADQQQTFFTGTSDNAKCLQQLIVAAIPHDYYMLYLRCPYLQQNLSEAAVNKIRQVPAESLITNLNTDVLNDSQICNKLLAYIYLARVDDIANLFTFADGILWRTICGYDQLITQVLNWQFMGDTDFLFIKDTNEQVQLTPQLFINMLKVLTACQDEQLIKEFRAKNPDFFANNYIYTTASDEQLNNILTLSLRHNLLDIAQHIIDSPILLSNTLNQASVRDKEFYKTKFTYTEPTMPPADEVWMKREVDKPSQSRVSTPTNVVEEEISSLLLGI